MAAVRGRAMALAALAAAVAYGAICLFLFLRQEAIIFHPTGPEPGARRWIAEHWPHGVEELEVEGIGRIELFHLRRGPNLPLLIWFNGNAMDAAEMAHHLASLQGFDLALWNYPGYGRSQGNPSQDAILRAALAVYDHLTRGREGQEILLVGRSLGSAVATYVAGKRRCSALVLITPFDSLVSIGRWHYPYIPVSLLLRHPFPAREWLKGVEVPILMVLAEHDDTVPHRFARALVAGHGGVEEATVPGVDHTTIGDSPRLYSLISSFWDRIHETR